MKMKYLFFCSAALVALLASCNGHDAKNDNQYDSIDAAVVEEVYIPASDDETYTPGVDYSEGVIGNGDDRTSQGAAIDYQESVGRNNGSDNNTYNHSDYYGD